MGHCHRRQPANAPKLDGQNLMPMVEQKDAKSEYKKLHFAWGTQWAVHEGDWKLIGNTRNPRVSLHNLADAKPEVKDHAKEKPAIVARLKALHDEWAKEVAKK